MKKYDISKFEPCVGGARFYAKYDTFEEAWQNCQRGDWMLWIASKLGVDIRTLTLAKGHCAATFLPLMNDERSKKAVEVAIKFGNGDATIEELNAASAAADAAYAASADGAAAYAAYAAYAASDAAACADGAAFFPAYAAAESKKKTSDICRKYLTEEVFKLITNK